MWTMTDKGFSILLYGMHRLVRLGNVAINASGYNERAIF